MFGLISAGISLAGLGMNAVQAIQEGRKIKQAKADADAAIKSFKNINEQNPYKELGVPTLGFDLAQQGIDRSAMSALSAAQGAGAEGVIGAAGNIVQANNAANLDLAAQANEAQAERDQLVAGGQAAINERKAEREAELAGYQLGQANTDATTASENRASSVAGMLTSAKGVASGIEDWLPVYKKKKSNQQ